MSEAKSGISCLKVRYRRGCVLGGETPDIASLIRATDTVSNLKGEAAAPRTTRREPCYREVMASSRRSTDLPQPGDKNANLDKICAFRCDCSWHRRYGIGCDQEPENCSASERPIHSGCRSAHRPVFQSVRSGSHRRRYPRLQSKNPLLTKLAINAARTIRSVNGQSAESCLDHAGVGIDVGLRRIGNDRQIALLPCSTG